MDERTNVPPKVVLASGSPRRRELLAMVGCPFEAVTPEVDENQGQLPASPALRVEELARRKAAAVMFRFPDRIIVSADTLVVLGSSILGKPKDRQEAVEMLQRLSGRWHAVYTGVAVRKPFSDHIFTRHACTKVRFRTLRPTWIERYVDTGEPMDKAGAYGIQGKGSLLVREIQGCYFNVVGLPLGVLAEMLEECGVSLL